MSTKVIVYIAKVARSLILSETTLKDLGVTTCSNPLILFQCNQSQVEMNPLHIMVSFVHRWWTMRSQLTVKLFSSTLKWPAAQESSRRQAGKNCSMLVQVIDAIVLLTIWTFNIIIHLITITITRSSNSSVIYLFSSLIDSLIHAFTRSIWF